MKREPVNCRIFLFVVTSFTFAFFTLAIIMFIPFVEVGNDLDMFTITTTILTAI